MSRKESELRSSKNILKLKAKCFIHENIKAGYEKRKQPPPRLMSR
jgi:hypothetical protein